MIELEVCDLSQDQVKFRISRQDIPESFLASKRSPEDGSWAWICPKDRNVTIACICYPEVNYIAATLRLYLRGSKKEEDDRILACSLRRFNQISEALEILNKELKDWAHLLTLEEEFFIRIAPQLAPL